MQELQTWPEYELAKDDGSYVARFRLPDDEADSLPIEVRVPFTGDFALETIGRQVLNGLLADAVAHLMKAESAA